VCVALKWVIILRLCIFVRTLTFLQGVIEILSCPAQNQIILPVCVAGIELVLNCLPDDMAHVSLNPIL
jgi:hypothetical protein